MAHAVDAAGVILLLLLMAASAVGRRQIFVMVELLDPVVTIDAIQLAVGRQGKTVRRKHGEGYFLAVHDPRVVGVGMAIEAVGAGKFFNGVGRRHAVRDRKWKGR